MQQSSPTRQDEQGKHKSPQSAHKSQRKKDTKSNNFSSQFSCQRARSGKYIKNRQTNRGDCKYQISHEKRYNRSIMNSFSPLIYWRVIRPSQQETKNQFKHKRNQNFSEYEAVPSPSFLNFTFPSNR